MGKQDRRIGFKCSEHEIEVLNKKIANTSLTKSEFLRQSIFFNQIKTTDKTFQKKQLFLLNNIANNCNQIAKYCNTFKKIDIKTLNNLEELLSYVKSIGNQNDN